MTCQATTSKPWSCPDGQLLLRADAPREEWLAARRAGIGSSDASAVLGLNRWTSAYEVWAQKRGLLPPDPGSDATELGHLLEPVVVGRWSERSGVAIRKAGLMANRMLPWQLASVDRLAECGGIVEAKTLSWRVAEEWEDGQTPDHAEVQVQHQLAVTGRSHAHVVGLQDGRTWLERTVVRDQALIDDLTKIEAEFWRMVVDGVEPPIDGSAATTEALNGRWPALDDVEVELDAEAVNAVALRAHALDRVREWQTAADRAENKLRALLGEATVGLLPILGSCSKCKTTAADCSAIVEPESCCARCQHEPRKVTWRRNGTFRTKAFTEAHPDIAAAITHPIPQLDVAALKSARPELHTQFRARVLRVPTL